MSYTAADVSRLCKIAKESGATIETWDCGFSAGCGWPGYENHLLIAEVYRAERDGYIGSKIITELLLKEWLESWRKNRVIEK